MLQFTVSKRGSIFDALDFPGCKDAGKFALQQIAFLASQDAEDIFSQHRTTRYAQLAEFTVTIPGNNLETAIDCVKRERQAINDRFDEAALRLHFRGASLNFNRQISRCLTSGLIKTGNAGGQCSLLRSRINQPANSFITVFTLIKSNYQRALRAIAKPERRRIFHRVPFVAQQKSFPVTDE